MDREQINRELRIRIAEATAEDIQAAWALLHQMKKSAAERE